MNPTFYKSAMEGGVAELGKHKEVLDKELTPNQNTILHVATQFGQVRYVEEVLEACPSLLCRPNVRGEIPLHMAAREGQAEVVKSMIARAKKRLEEELESSSVGAVKEMLRATNVDGDTALHMAARNCHLKKGNYLEVIKLLSEEDKEFQYSPNNFQETPLYLAAEKGEIGVAMVGTLVEAYRSQLTYGGPYGKTALHAAALHDYTGESTKKLLEWKKDLIYQVDGYGWTPLHYAASNWRAERSVKELLAVDPSVAYITTGKDVEYTSTTNMDRMETALHIAAAHGNRNAMETLLSYNPDCWEMVNGKGQNVLHTAVEMNRESVIKFILAKYSWVEQLINQKDNVGNTPLHLLADSDFNLARNAMRLWNHERADKEAYNGNNMTPNELKDQTALGRNTACNSYKNLARLAEFEREEERKKREEEVEELKKREEERKRKIEANAKNYREWFQTLMVVAALIATIAFAAAYAIPGGYDGNQGRHQGMAVLARAIAFKTFVITNTIAMMCSVISIFVCITGLWYSYREDDETDVRANGRYLGAVLLVLVAMFAIMLAFMAATFAVLAHSKVLALFTCIIAGIPFIAYTVEVVKFIYRSTRTSRRHR